MAKDRPHRFVQSARCLGLSPIFSPFQEYVRLMFPIRPMQGTKSMVEADCFKSKVYVEAPRQLLVAPRRRRRRPRCTSSFRVQCVSPLHLRPGPQLRSILVPDLRWLENSRHGAFANFLVQGGALPGSRTVKKTIRDENRSRGTGQELQGPAARKNRVVAGLGPQLRSVIVLVLLFSFSPTLRRGSRLVWSKPRIKDHFGFGSGPGPLRPFT